MNKLYNELLSDSRFDKWVSNLDMLLDELKKHINKTIKIKDDRNSVEEQKFKELKSFEFIVNGDSISIVLKIYDLESNFYLNI